MSTLFLRFYMGGVLAFVVIEIIILGLLFSTSAEDVAVVEDSLRGGALLAKQQADAHPSEQAKVLSSLENTFGYEVRVASASDKLPQVVGTRFASGEELVYADGRLFVQLEQSDGFLVMGPLPSFGLPPTGSLIQVSIGIALLWALVTWLLLRPVFHATRRVEQAAEKMSGGQLSARIEVTGAFTDLATSFNKMAETTEALVERQRELLAAVSHEFRTPLSRLRFASEMVGREESADERKELLGGMDADVEELEKLVEELLAFIRIGSRDAASAHVPMVLAEVLAPLIERHRQELCGGAVEIQSDLDGCDSIRANPRLVIRAIDNLIRNARHYAKSKISVVAVREGCDLVVRVGDDGPGIAPEDRERVLAPFVRLDAKADSSGVGLGLAIVERIVENHNGVLQLESSSLGGVCAITRWPLA